MSRVMPGRRGGQKWAGWERAPCLPPTPPRDVETRLELTCKHPKFFTAKKIPKAGNVVKFRSLAQKLSWGFVDPFPPIFGPLCGNMENVAGSILGLKFLPFVPKADINAQKKRKRAEKEPTAHPPQWGPNLLRPAKEDWQKGHGGYALPAAWLGVLGLPGRPTAKQPKHRGFRRRRDL